MRVGGKKGGFSLVEAAMVLAIIGMVVGAIWVVAADVRNKTLYNAYVSDLVVAIDNINKNIPRLPATSAFLGNYIRQMGLEPAKARYDIETLFGVMCTAAPSGDNDFCLMIGDTLSAPLSQTQCKYIGLALRSILSGNPMLMKEVTAVNDDGEDEVWWTREGGFTSLGPNCGRDVLAMKPGTHKDTIMQIRF